MNIDNYKEKQLRFLKKYWYINVTIIIIGLVIFFIKVNQANIESEEIIREYPFINSDESIQGVVTDIIKVQRGSQLRVELNNGLKKTIGWASNGLYDPPDLSDFIVTSDYISKDSRSDTIFIYRNNKKYQFLLFKRLNEN